MEVAAFFAIAAAGMWGFPYAGVGMAAVALALSVPAMEAHDYAHIFHLFRCDEACDGQRGWASTEDAWQWTALWTTALVGTVAVWASVALGVGAAATGLYPRTRRFARRAHLVAAIPMAIAVASFGAFTIFVAPFGDAYGI
jgi:hypothetical protein